MLWLFLLASEFFFFTFLLEYICFTVLLVSALQQSDSVTCVYISPLCHHRALSAPRYTTGYISFWWEICCYFIFNFFLEGKVSLLSVFIFFFIVFVSLALMCLMFLCCCLVTKSCLIFGDHTDCSLPGSSSVHGISQARILECIAIVFSRDLPDPEIKSMSTALAGGFFTTAPPGLGLSCLDFLSYLNL